MKNLVMLIQSGDNTTAFKQIMTSVSKEDLSMHQQMRDGVFPISPTIALYDLARAHGVFVKVCSALLEKDRPYLCIPIPSTDGWMASGTLSEEVRATLKQLSVPGFCDH